MLHMKNAVSLFVIVLALSAVTYAQSLVKVEAELLGHIDKLAKASNYGGTQDYDTLRKENLALQGAFLKYGTRQDVLSYKFPKLSKKVYLTTSRDGKFRAYSWDSEEGGTQHDYVTVLQYKGKSGKVYAWSVPHTQNLEERGAGAFVHQIFQTDTAAGPVYLAVSTLIGSTSYAGQTISAYQIDGEKLDRAPKVIKTRSGVTSSISFGFDFFSVADHSERPVKLFSYDDTKKSFRFPVVIEDSKTPQGRVTNRYITYRFDGKHFIKVS
jgi:hypothetical protein